MASHELIDAHVAALAHVLPGRIVDELTDGLTETWQHHLTDGRTPAEAARHAIAEFGTVEQIVTAFVSQAPGRRTARLLLATGPLVGACWGTSLATAHAWTWTVPAAAPAVYGGVLLAVLAVLVAAATSRRSYRRARLGAVGGLGLAVLDVTMLCAVVLVAPGLAWPMALAVPASLTRIGLTAWSLPGVLR